jgi:serine/threonine protein phosphatase PrpC
MEAGSFQTLLKPFAWEYEMITSGTGLELIHIAADSALSPTRRNYGKPNEDYVVVDSENEIFIVLDGVSRDRIEGQYPHPSPALDVTRIFAEKAHASIIATRNLYDPKTSLIRAAEQGNKGIRDYNSRQEWDFLPGTVGIVCMIVDNRLHYVYVGDCLGYVIRQGTRKQFTYPQTRPIKEHVSEFSADEIRNVICNNKEHPYGYGVFTGDERVLDFLEYGQEALYKGDIIILATDGMNNLFNSAGLHFDLPLSAKELIRRAEDIERTEALPKADDKAVIVIEVK